jgi:hypothetical protein
VRSVQLQRSQIFPRRGPGHVIASSGPTWMNRLGRDGKTACSRRCHLHRRHRQRIAPVETLMLTALPMTSTARTMPTASTRRLRVSCVPVAHAETASAAQWLAVQPTQRCHLHRRRQRIAPVETLMLTALPMTSTARTMPTALTGRLRVSCVPIAHAETASAAQWLAVQPTQRCHLRRRRRQRIAPVETLMLTALPMTSTARTMPTALTGRLRVSCVPVAHAETASAAQWLQSLRLLQETAPVSRASASNPIWRLLWVTASRMPLKAVSAAS